MKLKQLSRDKKQLIMTERRERESARRERKRESARRERERDEEEKRPKEAREVEPKDRK